jgi:hypothetical protein
VLSRLKQSRLRFGLVYLAFVPIFGVVFDNLPAGSFHDSNILLERSLANDATGLIDGLTKSIKARIPEGTGFYRGNTRFMIKPGSVAVRRLMRPEHEGEDLLQKKGAIGVGTFIVRVQMSLGQGARIVSHHKLVRYYFAQAEHPSSEFNPPFDPPLSVLLPPPPIALPTTRTSDSGWISVPGPLNDRLGSFVGASEGDPYYPSGRFGRMFYVSATTITTLGLGDISPVSSTARLLIWMEALLGIVFIGLFLNDLARVWRGRAS